MFETASVAVSRTMAAVPDATALFSALAIGDGPAAGPHREPEQYLDFGQLSLGPPSFGEFLALAVTLAGESEGGEAAAQAAAWAFFGTAAASALDLSGMGLTELFRAFFGHPAVAARLCRLTCVSNSLARLPAELGLLGRLRVLNCSGNRLAALPAEMFAAGCLPALEDFDCSMNELAALPAGLALLPALAKFSCSFNRLRALPAEMFAPGGCPALQTLYCASNLIAALPPAMGARCPLTGARVGAPLLDTLDCRSNRLAGLPAGLLDGGGCTYLLCSGNLFAAP